MFDFVYRIPYRRIQARADILKTAANQRSQKNFLSWAVLKEKKHT